jgi:hypothetical protein
MTTSCAHPSTLRFLRHLETVCAARVFAVRNGFEGRNAAADIAFDIAPNWFPRRVLADGVDYVVRREPRSIQSFHSPTPRAASLFADYATRPEAAAAPASPTATSMSARWLNGDPLVLSD